MIGKKIKTAMCKKTGHMDSGKAFCTEGKKYEYYHDKHNGYAKSPYIVNSDSYFYSGFSHSMGEQFFNKYFSKEEDWLDDKDWVIL